MWFEASNMLMFFVLPFLLWAPLGFLSFMKHLSSDAVCADTIKTQKDLMHKAPFPSRCVYHRPTHPSYLTVWEGSYCSGEDGGVISSLCDGALLSWVSRELKSRFTTPASCFCRFAFGAARTKIWLGAQTYNTKWTQQGQNICELTGGLIIQQVLYVRNVVSLLGVPCAN